MIYLEHKPRIWRRGGFWFGLFEGYYSFGYSSLAGLAHWRRHYDQPGFSKF